VTEPETQDVLILGAGLAGLSAGYKLARLGKRVVVLEADPKVGGLAGSGTFHTQWGEFDYDNGPHRFHTGETHLNEEVLALLGDDVVEANRLSRIFLFGKFFNYPLHGPNVIRNLPKTVLVKAFLDYLAVKVKSLFKKTPDSNFENWVVNRFGRTLYKIFFGVYTEKTWGIPARRSAPTGRPSASRCFLCGTRSKKTLFKPTHGSTPRTLVSKFFYPKRGGIGRLCERYKEEIEKLGGEVRTRTRVTGVRHSGGRVVAVDVESPEGRRSIPASTVLSTIPCTVLSDILDPPAPQPVRDAVAAMKHRSMIFVYLILDRPKVTDDHWIYLPEDSITVHRLSEFKNFSPFSAPKDKTLLCAEITCDYGDELLKRDRRKPPEHVRRRSREDRPFGARRSARDL
jgi:protoporphyrinogen oxidase